MRFSLTLEADEPNSSIPINYQYPFSSWIYNTMNQGNPEFADFLHNKGYTDENKKFRLFCFSNLRMAKYRLEGDRLFLLENPQKLIISFYPLEALEPFVLGLFKNQEFSIGDRTGKTGFKVKSIEKLAVPEFKNCMEFSLLSPVHMARRNPFDNKQVDHLHPEHKDFELLLKQNLQSKYKAYHGVDIENKQEFRFELLSRPRSKVISIKKGEKTGSMLKSYLFDFRLTADKELIKTGYYAGFGKENSQGFGFAELKPVGL